MTDSKISIVLSSDDNFAQHMGVTIASILINAHTDDEFDFYILDGGISQKNRKKLEELKKLKNFNMEFLNLEHLDIPPSFYRLKIPSLLAPLNKALYLDCDLVIKTSLRPFWDENIDEYPVAAVEDPWVDKKELQNLLNTNNYFNSGVLLMNLEKLREENFEQTFISYMENPDNANIVNNKMLTFGDQNILNVTLNNRVKYVHLRWNMGMDTFIDDYDYSKKEEVIEARENQGIIHFTGKTKPWNHIRHPFKNEYFYYLINTPWRLAIFNCYYSMVATKLFK